MHAVQEIPQIAAEIAQKGHSRMKLTTLTFKGLTVIRSPWNQEI